MSILIKGMEMPTNCFLCPLSVLNENRLFCEVTKNEVLRAKIDAECPLVPVLRHGRLVEDIAVIEQIDEWLNSVGTVMVGHGLSYYGELLGCIEDAPTIIPAEEDTQKDGGQDDA